MRVTCIGNKATDLPVELVDLYGTPKTEFHVHVGHTYTVYAMQLGDGVLDVLICVDREIPEWKPMALFRVADPKIPDHWEFASFENNEEIERNREALGAKWGYRPSDTARLGYPDIVHSDEHYLGLIEHESDDLRTFIQERQRHEEH